MKQPLLFSEEDIFYADQSLELQQRFNKKDVVIQPVPAVWVNKEIKTKQQAVDEVENNANKVWLYTAQRIVETLAKTKVTFSSDDVWEELDRIRMNRPHEPSAMGAVFRNCARNKVCRKTGRYFPSKQSTNHQRDIAEWESYK